MKSLLNFIFKYHYFILFILLECLSLFFVVQYNNYQQAAFLNSSNRVAGSFYESVSSITHYFGLRQKNLELIEAISVYKNQSKNSYKNNSIVLSDIYDSVYIQQYQFLSAQVIHNSTNKQNNFLTLDKGSKHGVKAGMAVVSVKGIVGIVKDVSMNYSTVISILNPNLKISAMVKKNNYFGTLQWDGMDYRYVFLHDLPNHISIKKGDTIITSGFSTVFPKGQFVGVVNEVKDSQSGAFYNVQVALAEDLMGLSNVMVVKNLLKQEQLSIERSVTND